jgi:O-antigen ligase
VKAILSRLHNKGNNVEIAALLVALAAVVWILLLVQVHDVVTGTAIFLVATSVLPPEYASVEIGVSITADRVWLTVLIMQFLYDLWIGRSSWRAWSAADLFLMLFLLWLVLRTLVTPLGQEIKGQPSTTMHLINGYLVPALLYCILRNIQPQPRWIWSGVAVLLLFGAYLSLTAILEITKQWSLVWPGFIGDPKLGIHFGRARGPMLNSVRLGMCLCASLTALWTFIVWQRPKNWSTWIIAGILTPLFSIAIALTYTRSIWMAALAILVIMLLTMLSGKTRLTAVGGLVFSAVLAALIAGPNLVAFKREYSAAETLESTRMRGAFAYVSWKMFADRPLVGFGFNQFQVYNRPYLDDRTTDIRLESIRGYVHHNSYLSLLVDLGLIGGILFALASAAMLRGIWSVMRDRGSTAMAKSMTVFGMCLMASHAIQMAFHEVSFSSIEYTLLMFALGLTQAYRNETTRDAKPNSQPDAARQIEPRGVWST